MPRIPAKRPTDCCIPQAEKSHGGPPLTIPGQRGGRGKRIGLFWSFLCGGGVETVNRDIAEGLSRDQYIIDAYVWQARDTFLPMAAAFDELTVLNEPFEAYSPQEQLGPFTPISRVASFQRFLLERQYDAFIMACCWAPMWLAHMHRIPVIEYWHGYGCWNNWHMPSDAIVAVSETTQKQIEVHRPDHAPLTVIRNGVDYDRYAEAAQLRDAARKRFGLQPHAPVVLYCGRFSDEKRPLDAMRAFVKAREQEPTLQLLLVGTCLDGPRYVQLGRQIGCRWGVDTWHYELPHEEVVQAYAAADVMIHPSEWEGLGMVLLEAMAAGVPIVSTCAGGCGEVLRGACLPVGVGDIDAMAAGILRLIVQDRQRAYFVQEGRRRVREEFSLANNAARLAEVIESVVRQRPRPLTKDEVDAEELEARAIAERLMQP